MKYAYADGNGNSYIIKKKNGNITIEYKPIKPEWSSSGEYDGGDPVKKEIGQIDFEDIQSIFNKALESKESHVENRNKGTGQITMSANNEKRSCILKMHSEIKDEIETKLKEIIRT